LRARQQELLPVNYYHLVFSVPHALVPLIWQNQKVLFALMFETSAATLLAVAADPKHLCAEIGFLSILHTWGQTFQRLHTFTAWCPAAGYRRITHNGSRRQITSSCRCECSAVSFAASSSLVCGELSG
jgi:hypothetical protein